MIEDLKRLRNLGNPSRRRIQEELNCSEHLARCYYFILNNPDDIYAFLSREIEEFSKPVEDGMVASSPVSETLEELMEKFQIDKDYWDVTKSVLNEWGAWNNYNRQAKVWLKRKGDIIEWEEFKRDFIDYVKQFSPKVPKIERKEETSKKMFELSIYDLHLGKMAWHMESGNDYDSKIAQYRFFSALHSLIDNAKREKVELIVFPIGNDFFNSDKDIPFPQTTKGTPQESDLRWQKIYRRGREILTAAINMLKEIAPVHVIAVPGNHEEQKLFYMADALEAIYENDENVTVDNEPTLRKYFKYGNNLIGFTHGKDVPKDRLIHIMPQEKPQLWAETKYRHWHCGHKHKKETLTTKQEEDISGIHIKHLRSIKGRDAYETKKGYSSLGGAEAMIWDFEKGLKANYFYNL